ncbi:uncharacterized protein LOC125230153 [Leguminivora glycinivorella]|uniref:uncharacterized protein LOC125230153 n=1 Tax=Leguminivora glycinivorella TaxID=1035111 RepID=UPI00200E6866|nr:uncharacterized protein LOC125230153 [Leguminivora glycinivorella]
MWPSSVFLCLCAAALIVAKPILDKSIVSETGVSPHPKFEIQMSEEKETLQPIELIASETGASPDRDKFELRIPEDEKGMLSMELMAVPSGLRVKRSVMPRMCPKGKIRIGGICMQRETCEETGEC